MLHILSILQFWKVSFQNMKKNLENNEMRLKKSKSYKIKLINNSFEYGSILFSKKMLLSG